MRRTLLCLVIAATALPLFAYGAPVAPAGETHRASCGLFIPPTTCSATATAHMQTQAVSVRLDVSSVLPPYAPGQARATARVELLFPLTNPSPQASLTFRAGLSASRAQAHYDGVVGPQSVPPFTIAADLGYAAATFGVALRHPTCSDCTITYVYNDVVNSLTGISRLCCSYEVEVTRSSGPVSVGAFTIVTFVDAVAFLGAPAQAAVVPVPGSITLAVDATMGLSTI